MFEIALLKAASELDNEFEFDNEFVPFCNSPWVKGILVVIPNGSRLCLRVLYGTSCRLASL